MSALLYVERLALSDFRNHAAFELELDARPVCLFGPNGAGKTNVLEALTMLAPGRGLRGAALGEMARAPGAEARMRAWSVSARIVSEGEATTIGAAVERTDGAMKRIARSDGQPASAADLAHLMRIAWLTPAMDRLFSGPAGDRRRFLDRLTFAYAPAHGANALAYERAMRERQRLLGDDVAPDPAWLAGLERQMVERGAAIAHARRATVEALQAAIATRPESAFPRARLSLTAEADAETEDALAAAFSRGRRRDAAAGRTLEGPHRTDLAVRHAGKDMPAEHCSTGEQKALLIGLALAHAHASATRSGPTLLLIDEAGAHLDADRRAALYEELLVLPGQTWLTGTEAGLFEAFGDRARHIAL